MLRVLFIHFLKKKLDFFFPENVINNANSPWIELSSNKLRFSSVNSVAPFSDWGDESYLRGGFCTGFTAVISNVFCCSGSITIWWVTSPFVVTELFWGFFVMKLSARRQQTKHKHNKTNKAHASPAMKNRIWELQCSHEKYTLLV